MSNFYLLSKFRADQGRWQHGTSYPTTPNCNGLVQCLICSRNLEQSRVDNSYFYVTTARCISAPQCHEVLIINLESQLRRFALQFIHSHSGATGVF